MKCDNSLEFKSFFTEKEIKLRRELLKKRQITFFDKLESKLRVPQEELVVLLNLTMSLTYDEYSFSLLPAVCEMLVKHLVNAVYAYALFKQHNPAFDLEEFNKIYLLVGKDSSVIWTNESLENNLLSQISFLATFVNRKKRFADQWKLSELINGAVRETFSQEFPTESIKEIIDTCRSLLFLSCSIYE